MYSALCHARDTYRKWTGTDARNAPIPGASENAEPPPPEHGAADVTSAPQAHARAMSEVALALRGTGAGGAGPTPLARSGYRWKPQEMRAYWDPDTPYIAYFRTLATSPYWGVDTPDLNAEQRLGIATTLRSVVRARKQNRDALDLLLGSDATLLRKAAESVARLFGVAPADGLALMPLLPRRLMAIDGALHYLQSSALQHVLFTEVDAPNQARRGVSASWTNQLALLRVYWSNFKELDADLQAFVLLHEVSHATVGTDDVFYLTGQGRDKDNKVTQPLTHAIERHNAISAPKGRWALQAKYVLARGNPAVERAFTEKLGASDADAAIARFHSDQALRQDLLLHNADSLTLLITALAELTTP